MKNPAPRTVVDPTTGRPILLAPQRQLRPIQTGDDRGPSRCPFCRGHEHDTPPELDRESDGHGWAVRAVPNKYPAARHHEVVAEGGAHAEHPSELDLATWTALVRIWQRRVRAIEAADGVAFAYLFKNVGARAGASIAHNHSQLIGLATLPPRLELERQQQRAAGTCLTCRALELATRDDLVVCDDGAFVVLAPSPPKLPFESWLLPRRCEGDFLQADPAALAHTLRTWTRAVDGALDRPALNLWLHRVPPALLAPGEGFHWHFELQPRTGQLAGLELGGDMYINSVPPETTCARLRAALR
ncbi:MAG TPA: DUF4921 family protein [bacterium]|nr:DUF4921 family protein [bacterium]